MKKVVRRAHGEVIRRMRMDNDYFQTLFNSISDAILVYPLAADAEQKIFIEANDAACTMLHYRREELLTLRLNDICVAATEPPSCLDENLLSFDKNAVFKQVFVTKDGRKLLAEVNARLCTIKGSTVVIALFRDISAHDGLEKYWQRTQYFVDKCREAVFFVKSNASFTYVNESACRSLGYSKEELLSLRLFDIEPELTESEWQRYWMTAITTESSPRETIYRTKDGRMIPVEVVANTLCFSSDERYYCAYVRDISERVQAMKTLQASERKYRELVEHVNSIILRMDREGTITYLNEFGQHFFGYKDDEIIGRPVVGTIVPRNESTGRNLQQLIEGICLEPKKFERNMNENVLKSGKRVWIEWTNKAILDENGQLVEILSVGSDVTERRTAEQKMRQLTTAVQQSSDWILITDKNGKIEYVNNAVEQITGFTSDEIIGKTPRIFKSGKYDRAFYQHMWDTILSGQTYTSILTNRKKNGQLFDIYHTITPIKDDSGYIAHFVVTSKDLTTQRELEKKINFLANYDSLTGLPNRNLFVKRLMQSTLRSEHDDKRTAIVFIDIDRFHFLNEAFGLSVGNACLMEIAKRLPQVVREGDILARFGSDEFVVALIDLKKPDDVIVMLKGMRALLSRPIMADYEEMVLSYSIGISIFPDDNQDIQSVLHNADIACRKAKEMGGNSYQFFTPDMNITASEFMLMEQNLFAAMKRNEFMIHYQPYFDIRTRKMIGAEALLRWQLSDGVIMSPGTFIPVLEKTGMIVEVGERVLRLALSQIRTWQKQNLPVVPIAINLSPIQFQQKNLIATIKGVLNEMQVPPELLVLEITEGAFIEDIKYTKTMLEELKNIGVSIAIDDFGTGYSSLSYLKKFPVDRLKIDISFIREIASDADAASIVSAIITMANALHLETIAEGIETEEQLIILESLQCNAGQGYYLQRPMTAEALERMWKQGQGF